MRGLRELTLRAEDVSILTWRRTPLQLLRRPPGARAAKSRGQRSGSMRLRLLTAYTPQTAKTKRPGVSTAGRLGLDGLDWRFMP